jgi:hypothetical protein
MTLEDSTSGVYEQVPPAVLEGEVLRDSTKLCQALEGMSWRHLMRTASSGMLQAADTPHV